MSAGLVGSLRHRLTLERPVRTDDGAGGASITWSAVGQLFGSVRLLTGRERTEADGRSARVSHEILIRYTADVGPQMRFVEGARIFDIGAVLELEGRRRWLKCLCEERLP